jgi:hypothetical protein
MTTWKVKKRKNDVRLEYELRENHREIVLKTYSAIIEAIAKKTGHTFVCSGTPYQSTSYPYFNLDSLIDNQHANMRWTIDDEQRRARFIAALNELGNQLRGANVLEGVAIDINKLLKDIIRDRNNRPLLITGVGTYRIVLEEDTFTPQSLPDEFRAAITIELEDMKKASDDLVIAERELHAREIERIKLESKDLYNIGMRDVIEGWTTFLQDDHVRLAKAFKYAPTHYTYRGITYIIKEDVRTKHGINGYIIYDKDTGRLIVKTKTETMRTPHTQHSDGTLCLGSLQFRPKLELADAKTFVTRTISMLSVINRDSLAANSWGDIDVYDTDRFIENYTVSTIKEDIIDPLAEGVII